MKQQTKVIKPMTRAEWEALPAIVRYFHHWKRAKRPMTIPAHSERGTSAAVEYFTQPLSSLRP